MIVAVVVTDGNAISANSKRVPLARRPSLHQTILSPEGQTYAATLTLYNHENNSKQGKVSTTVTR